MTTIPRTPKRGASARPPGILLRMRRKNAWNGITRAMLRELARRLNLTETDAIHMALADRARFMGLLPTRAPKLVQGPEDLAGFDLSEFKRVLELGMRTAAEDKARATQATQARPRVRSRKEPRIVRK